MKKETKESLVFWFAVASTLLTFVALIALIAAQTYIRWAVNQDFRVKGKNWWMKSCFERFVEAYFVNILNTLVKYEKKSASFAG